MTTSKKFVDLLEDLKAATIEGKVTWQETAAENQFRARLGGPMVRVSWDWDDHSETAIYSAYLLSVGAKVVDGVTSSEDPATYKLLEELYGLARRSARRADEVIDKALGYIRQDSPEN